MSRQAFQRETAWDSRVGSVEGLRSLGTDLSPPLIYFLFDCGQLDQDVSIRLAPGEIRNYAFIEVHHLGRYLTVQNHAQLRAALRARTANALTYMPDLLRNPP